MMELKRLPLVSIVVPVYRAEHAIARCIESILNQTHQNLELILIDDGSPDRCGEICDEYAKKDQRIRVIHTPNRGVSSARNQGLECAQGDYLLFVDSDDWIEQNHVEVLLPVDDEDLVYGGTKLFRNGVLFDIRTPSAYVATREEWIQDYDGFCASGRNIFFIHPCYRLSVIRDHNLRFDTKISCGEDGMFNVSFLKYSQKIRYSETSTYCYEDGDDTSDSLSHKFHPQYIQANIAQCKTVEDMTQKKEYALRWTGWKGTFRHYGKWVTFHDGIHKEEAVRAIKTAYRTEYFRECIPYIRKNGYMDQKVESFFMRYWLHPLYQPCYSVIAALSKIKRLITRR